MFLIKPPYLLLFSRQITVEDNFTSQEQQTPMGQWNLEGVYLLKIPQ